MNLNIVVAGTGYAGLSHDDLITQHNKVTVMDIVIEKVALIKNRKSPMGEYIKKYLTIKNWILTQLTYIFAKLLQEGAIKILMLFINQR